jgi:hypothetical protein
MQVGNHHAKLKIRTELGCVKLLDNFWLVTCQKILHQTKDVVCLSCLVPTVIKKFKLIVNLNIKKKEF